MKILALFALLLCPLFFYGQTTASIPEISKSLDQSKMNKKDCVIMNDGKMLMMKDGKTMDMPAEIRLNNGTIVQKNGTVKMPDGTTKSMKDGDQVDMDGVWSRSDKLKVGEE